MAGKVLEKVFIFFEAIKFEHSIFALPFAYLGLFLAERGWPTWRLFFWITVAMVSFRTFGMGINRVVDRAIDARNPRTEGRALPAGLLKVNFVVGISLISLFIFEISAFRLSPLCLSLSWIPVLFAVLYPWMKRFTWLSHFILGIILGIAPYGAWIASRGSLSWIPAFLMVGVGLWVAGFDMIYALQDMGFDRESGLHSFPAKFGQAATLNTTGILHLTAMLAWAVAGWIAGLGLIYFSGLGFASFLLIRQNWLIRTFGMSKIQEAFFRMNAVVSTALFLSVFLDFFVGSFRG